MHETERKSVLLKVHRDTNLDKDFSILSKRYDAFIVINLQGKIEYASHACESLLGYSRESLELLALNKLFISDFLDQKHTFFKGREQEKLDDFDVQVQWSDGSISNVHVTSIPIFFEKDCIGSYLVLKNRTSIKQTIEREKEYQFLIDHVTCLSEKQATTEQLASGIVHEIRDPIIIMKGFLQLYMADNNPKGIYLEVIQSEIDRIEGILNELDDHKAK
ncbi:PAS domain S-box protein [Niallia sp. Krafla_26]|uniref:PAS domain S-box protein n=1 Tax=Niallia sp. Krafla_26 TaxID=3064703 RepID=UPI003D166942